MASSSPADSTDVGFLVFPSRNDGPHDFVDHQSSPPSQDTLENTSSMTGLGGSIQRPTGTPPAVQTTFTYTASISPDQPLDTNGPPSRPTGSPVGPYDMNEGGGPSHSQVIAAITVPTLIIFFALMAFLAVLFRRKQKRLQRADELRSKGMESYYSPQQGGAAYQLPRRPTAAARAPVLPAVNTQFFGEFGGDQRGTQEFYQGMEHPSQSAVFYGWQSFDSPPPYLSQIHTEPNTRSTVIREPSHLTEAALSQHQPANHRSTIDDDVISQASERLHGHKDIDSMSAVSDISYQDQRPVAEHNMV